MEATDPLLNGTDTPPAALEHAVEISMSNHTQPSVPLEVPDPEPSPAATAASSVRQPAPAVAKPVAPAAPQTSARTASPSQRMSAAAIGGIVAGIIVPIIAAIILGFVVARWRWRKRMERDDDESIIADSVATEVVPTLPPPEEPRGRQFSPFSSGYTTE